MMMAAVVQPLANTGYFVEASRKRPLEHAHPASAAAHDDFVEFKREKSEMDDLPYENGLNITLAPPLPGQLILKVLIPGYAAGAVIGKGGQIIVQLQKDSGAIIKLSKAKDFYPGTQDRVVLIQGTAEGLMKVQNTIIDKVYDFPVPKDLAAIIGDRPKQVKIIVPNTTAGLVIGKSGATIRQIMEESGSKVQLSQKPEGVNVQERVITIKGEKHQLIAASNIIVDKIKDDPQSASCPHISYSQVLGPVANANPTGSPYASGSTATLLDANTNVPAMLGHYIIPGGQHLVQAVQPTQYVQQTLQPGADLASFNALANYGYTLSGTTLIPNLQHPSLTGAGGVYPIASLAGSVNPVQSGQLQLSAAAFQGDTALTTAGMQRALSIPNGYLTNLSPYQLTATSQAQLLGAASPGLSLQHHHQPQQHPPAATTPTNLSVASSQPVTPSLTPLPAANPHQTTVGVLSIEKSADGQKETIDLAVPENLIGAILGKAGRTLIEYQDISGAKIQISKKGEHLPGTRNRRVSITGRPPCPQTAQFLITQRIASAQSARAQQAEDGGRIALSSFFC